MKYLLIIFCDGMGESKAGARRREAGRLQVSINCDGLSGIFQQENIRNRFSRKLTMTKDYLNRKYDIVSYDSGWASRFLEEVKILSPIFGKYSTSIEHIGSTAVPGLAGKPTIDILILVEDVSEIDRLNQKMEFAGYKVLGEYVMPGARLFVREVDNTRLCNIHVFQKEHTHAKEMLRLRDYFRDHPEFVKEYNQLKLDLVEKYPNDYGQYRKHKDVWLEKLLGKIL